MKPADHPVPSGDRETARLFLRALAAAGYAPETASTLRCYEGQGDGLRQETLRAEAQREADRLIQELSHPGRPLPAVWFSYHVYYKAPDLIGPVVARHFGLPYVIAEASRAAKRHHGPWATFAAAADAAIDAADLVLCLTQRDSIAIQAAHRPGQQVTVFPPFLDVPDACPAPPRSTGPVRLLTVAMMRPGDKLASYHLLASSLSRLTPLPWQLEIVGGGPAEAEVRSLFAPLGTRVTFTGQLTPEEVRHHYHRADLLVWPGLNEAFGMTYLEAQAQGVPVVAVANAGVPSVVTDGLSGALTPETPEAYAQSLADLITDAGRRQSLRQSAHQYVLSSHSLPAAAQRLTHLLDGLRR